MLSIKKNVTCMIITSTDRSIPQEAVKSYTGCLKKGIGV